MPLKRKMHDPLYAGVQHILNNSHALHSPSSRVFEELAKHTGSLTDSLRYVGTKSKLPRQSPAQADATQAQQRLGLLEQ